jgi:hypothetical protein
MSDIRQLRVARWKRIEQRGIWRFAFFRGVLGWGVFMSIFGIIFERVSWKVETLSWYFIVGICLVVGFFVGLRCSFF